ncbi:MAG: MFS transporter [Candidatus Dormibacteria bacterium]
MLACLSSEASGGIAALALVLRLSQTGSSWAVAGLWLAGTVPAVALAPLIGLLLDRVETVGLLRNLAIASAVLVVGLAVVPGVLPVLALAALLGIAAATTAPGLLAIAAVVGGGAGPARSMTRIQAAQWAGSTVGPAVGAGLVVAWGTRIPLLLDAASLLLLVVALTAVRARRLPTHRPSGETRTKAITAGLAILAGNRGLRRLLPPVLLVITFVNVAVVVEVFLATQVFRAGPWGYGGLVALWGGGLVLGTLTVPRLARLNPLLVAGAGAGLAALGLAGAGLSPGLPPALLAYLLGGFGNGLEMNSVRIMVQKVAPAATHGRAFAAYFALGSGAAAVGSGLGGGLLGVFAVRPAMLVASLAVAIAAIWLLAASSLWAGLPLQSDFPAEALGVRLPTNGS